MLGKVLILAFFLIAVYATAEAWKQRRFGLALFAMFWVGYNARSLIGMIL